jgi:hypothetical protein
VQVLAPDRHFAVVYASLGATKQCDAPPRAAPVGAASAKTAGPGQRARELASGRPKHPHFGASVFRYGLHRGFQHRLDRRSGVVASRGRAGLRANEARYFKNKYDHDFTVEPASKAQATINWVHHILKEERDIVVSSRPLEATAFQVENIRMAYVFYESGLSMNVMYTIDGAKKRAVGFKLSDGMEVPVELADRFKFARQKSKLAGTIRGSCFVLKNEYWPQDRSPQGVAATARPEPILFREDLHLAQ